MCAVNLRGLSKVNLLTDLLTNLSILSIYLPSIGCLKSLQPLAMVTTLVKQVRNKFSQLFCNLLDLSSSLS